MISPVSVASPDMPTGIGISADSATGDGALFSAALSQAVAVGGADASALVTPDASTPASVNPAQVSTPVSAVAVGDTPDGAVSSPAPARPPVSPGVAGGLPGAIIQAPNAEPAAVPGESAALQAEPSTAAAVIGQVPQDESVASTEAAPDPATGGQARCEIDPPVKGRSPAVKAARADASPEPEPAPATGKALKPDETERVGKEPRQAESDPPSREKPPLQQSVPIPVTVPIAVAVNPAAETIAAEAAPATAGDSAPVRPASARTHTARAAQQPGTAPGTVPEAPEMLAPHPRDQVAQAFAASIDTAQPKQPARRDDAPMTLLAAAAAPDAAAPAGDLASPTLSQQMSAALIGGHNHSTEFAAHLETLADQIFVHGRDQHQARFMVDAAELGPVSIEVARRAEGVSVAFGTDNELARAAIADAQPRLVSDARLAGLTLSQSRVDTGGHREGRNGRQEPRGSVAAVGRSSTIKATVQSGSDRFA